MNSNNTLVSIVTPSYNSARFISETIECVKNQTYPYIEHIIVDGGSDDGTLEILNEYPHLRYISEPDHGQSNAINKGFQMASGEIIGWINADDTYHSNAVATAVDYFDEHEDVNLIYCDYHVIDENSNLIRVGRSRPFNLITQLSLNCVSQQTVFMRRSLLDCVGGVNENLHFCMDREFWFRIGARFSLEYFPGVTFANFRVHNEAKSSKFQSRFHSEWLSVLEDAVHNPLYDKIPYSAKQYAILQTRTRLHLTQINEAIRAHNLPKFANSVGSFIFTDWKYVLKYLQRKMSR